MRSVKLVLIAMEKVKSENKSPSWDLRNLLDLVQASFKEKNYEEALKAALLGLDMAVARSWRIEKMELDNKMFVDAGKTRSRRKRKAEVEEW